MFFVFFSAQTIRYSTESSQCVWIYSIHLQCPHTYFFSFFFLNLTYSRWTSSLPSCLWSQRIFPSLPGSRLTIFYRDASSPLLQLVNQWLNFTYSRSHAFRYERKNTNPTLVRIELTTSALAGVQVTYETTLLLTVIYPKCYKYQQVRHATRPSLRRRRRPLLI